MLTTFLSPFANHLWQSPVFAVAAGLLTLVFRKTSARTRHWIWLTASLKFLIPFSLLINFGGHFSPLSDRALPFEPSVSVLVIDQVAQPFTFDQVAVVPSGPRGSESGGPTSVVTLLAVWLSGSLVLSFRWCRNWMRIQRIVRQATIVNRGREIEALRRLERTIGMEKSITIASSACSIDRLLSALFTQCCYGLPR